MMGRGLGDTQRRALAALTVPLTVSELGETISTKPRYTRRIVAALVERGLVVVAADDGGPRLAWLTERREAELARQRDQRVLHEYVTWVLHEMREKPSRSTEAHCPHCGTWIRTSV